MLRIGLTSNIHEEVKNICEEYNLTSYKLSKYCNISPTYAYNLLHGNMMNPSARIIKKINDGLKENEELLEIEKRRGAIKWKDIIH